MPLGKLLSAMGGSRTVPLDDGSWLPPPASHPVPVDDGPAYDLAVQARLRRERAASGAETLLCLGPEPMSPGKKAFWSFVFLLLGLGLLAAAGFGLLRGWGVLLLVCGFLGLVISTAAGYFFLASFNPTLSLRCERDRFAPGEPATVRWRFSRPPRRARALEVRLVCTENATYRRGTSDTTDHEAVFDEARVEQAAGPAGPSVEGAFELNLPADAMHSFEAADNSVAWTLRARAAVSLWPDVTRVVTLRVWSGPEPKPAEETP